MKSTSLVFALVAMAVLMFATGTIAAHYRYEPGTRIALPDKAFTPGDVLRVTSAQICHPGYSRSVRDVPEATKLAVYREYGVERKPGVCCEVDHLVPLSIGGANTILNLWPEPYLPRPGARQKDVLEDHLHRLVCSGKMPLATAQKLISGDWYQAYLRIVR